MLDPLVADAQRVYGHLAAAGIEKCRDGLADAPAQGTVLDRDHMAELGTDPGQQGLVERFGEAQVVMRHAHALRRGAFRGTGGSVADRPDRHQRHVRTFAKPPSPADGQRLEGNAPPPTSRTVAARVADHEGMAVLQTGIHHVAEFQFIHRRSDRKSRHGTECSHVEDPVVGHAVLAHDAAPVEAHHHGQILDRDVVDHIVVSPLHERRIDVAERHHARSGHPGREGHGMALGDTHVEATRRHGVHEHVHRTPRRHGRRDAHDPRVEPGQFDERLAEDILVTRRGARRGDPLARIGIETSGGMPRGLVVLGRQVALALHGHDMQQLGPFDVAQCPKRAHQLLEVVAVDGAEIAEIEALEEVALVQHPLFHGVARLLAEAQQARRMRKDAPQPLLETVVVHRCGDFEQVVLQCAGGLVDGHVVVIEDHQDVGAFAGPGIVEPFEREAAGHRTVADDGHDLVPLAPHFSSFGHAERRRNRHRGMPAPESVVGALGHARETADAAQQAFGLERLAAPGDNLVGIGLVPHVPDDLVRGRIENVVECGGEFHAAEARRQMPGIYRALVDDIAAQLVAVGTQFLRRELLEVAGRIYFSE